MNRKISRNEKHKYSNEEKLALGEDENTSALINISQEDDRNIYFRFYITFTAYRNVLDAVVFKVGKALVYDILSNHP